MALAVVAATAMAPVGASAKVTKASTPAASTSAASAPAPTSAAMVVKLIELLIQNGALTREQADALLKQAQAEADAQARREREAAGAAGAAAGAAGAAAGAAGTAAGVGAGAAAAPDVPAGTVRVPYIPETVKRQITQQLRQEVTQQARDEGWAEPNVVPSWVNRFKLSGDVRTRYEGDYLDNGNGQFPNFNDINDGNGLAIFANESEATALGLGPLLNSDQDRDRFQLRGRLQVDAEVDDWVSAAIRIATGNNNSPVSTNQTLGNPGDYSKYNLWLDRAYMRFDLTKALAPVTEGATQPEAIGYVGRMPNPFWTSDLMFDADLNFDGAALQTSYMVNKDTEVFLNAGGFPVFNTDFNFPSLSGSNGKIESRDAYLYAGQVGAQHKINKETSFKSALGFFDFENINGKLSSPCTPSLTGYCDTDDTRPAFVQKGNSMIGLRDLVFTAADQPEGQYFGLASEFGVLDFYNRFDVATWDPINLWFEADFAWNLFYDRSEIVDKGAVNPLEGSDDNYDGGNFGFMLRANVGRERIREPWEWNAYIGYKYVESDAVVDAFTDSDFHLGGTNAKGYFIGGSLGIAKNTYFTMRWMSADEVSGTPAAIDVFQFDLNARF